MQKVTDGVTLGVSRSNHNAFAGFTDTSAG
jgi:hypothetical protein